MVFLNPGTSEAMARVSDGAIVGSAIVKIVAEHGEHADQALFDYVQSMKQAMLKLTHNNSYCIIK